jgi:N-acetyl-gamma-glutamyl-phosphate reductase
MKVSVIGATGYTGYELVKILAVHPEFEISALVSETNAGQKFSEVYPRLRGVCDTEIMGRDYEKVAEMSDAVFLCLPHAAAQDAAAFFHGKGKKVVDFSADFRIKDKELYEKTYSVDHNYDELLKSAVYGLPEINGEKVKNASIVANPGCYPTSVITPLYPLLKEGLIEPKDIIADAKSGVTGAGKKASVPFSFCECNEDFKPYGIFKHRHNPEINHILGDVNGDIDVLFTPHLLPVNKGIETTIYVKSKANIEEISRCMKDFYEGRRFVRIYDDGHVPSTNDVVDTNFIDIGLFKQGDRLIIVSVIDNLIKGSSGMAVQNLNLMCGLPETCGIL